MCCAATNESRVVSLVFFPPSCTCVLQTAESTITCDRDAMPAFFFFLSKNIMEKSRCIPEAVNWIESWIGWIVTCLALLLVPDIPVVCLYGPPAGMWITCWVNPITCFYFSAGEKRGDDAAPAFASTVRGKVRTGRATHWAESTMHSVI